MRKIKFNTDSLALFADYIKQVISHKLNEASSTFNRLLKFHLQSIAEKLHKVSVDLLYNARKAIAVRFNHGELLTLSYAFKQMQIHPYLSTLEVKILEGL